MKTFKKLFDISGSNSKTDKGILRSLYFKTVVILSIILLLIELTLVVPACNLFGFSVQQAALLSTLVYLINIIALLIWIIFLTKNNN